MKAALGAVLLALVAGRASAQTDYVARCRSEVRGTKIWMSSAVASRRPELTPRLEDVDIPRYCDCFHRRLRSALGDDLYGRSRSMQGELSPAELEKNSEEGGKAVITCVAEQVGSEGAAAAASSAGRPDKLARFMSGAVAPGGIGGLRLGDSKEALFAVLGPTKTFKTMRDGGESYYYGRSSTEVTVSLSPPPARVVRGIEVGFRFQGATPGGARIGDARDAVKGSYPGRMAIDAPTFAVYCDGTTFHFQDGRLRSIRLSDLASDVFKEARAKACGK